MKNKNLYLLIISTFMMLISCTEEDSISLSDPNQSQNTGTVTYTTNVKSIIDNNCISCHGASNPSAGFNISTYTNAKNNINAIINRADLQTGQPGIMPPSGRMSSSKIQILKDWQTQGFIQ